MTALVWLLLSRPRSSEPKILASASDAFESAQLDTNKWTWSWTNWPTQGNKNYPGTHRRSVVQSNGELLLEATAQHEGGYSTGSGVWLDCRQDLRRCGECSVEIELSGTNQNGHLALCISEGAPPVDVNDPNAAGLLRMPERGTVNNLAPLRHNKVRIDFLPDHAAAAPHPRLPVGKDRS